eukprot:TRINITY_DN641_c0_g1_i2.p1 TRINITY_DN641_c0_g1~~TRINITY_DN641_c0_g1_i2.p1  ORF type:complete len:398 (-),score=58.30 TRINITY_DN641_c0_g1_i2:149-1342(-)
MRCSGDYFSLAGSDQRLCMFRYVCMDQHRLVHFYRETEEPVLFDPVAREVMQFDRKPFINLNSRITDNDRAANKLGTKQTLSIVAENNQTVPSRESVSYVDGVTHIAAIWAHDFNIGHVLWEDLSSVYIGLRAIGMTRQQVHSIARVVFVNSPRRDDLVHTLFDGFMRPLFAVAPVFWDEVKPAHRLMCFHTLVAGGMFPTIRPEDSKSNIIRAGYYFEMRNAILEYHGLDPYARPTEHHIVIVKKSQSVWTHKMATMHRALYNVDEAVEYIRKTYLGVKVTIVEFQTMSTVKEQLKLLISATIIISPCGGVSLTIPFMPIGSHAIVTDFLEKGKSIHMDQAVLGSFPHMRTLYYELKDDSDIVKDFPTAKNKRNDFSILLKFERLKLLLDMAFRNE